MAFSKARSPITRHAWAALGVVTAASLLLSACTAPEESDPDQNTDAQGVFVNEWGGEELSLGDPVYGGEFTYGAVNPAEHLDPAGAIGLSLESIAAQIYDRLMRFDAEGAVVPELAESLESDDNLVWTMTLPTGVVFTDGTPFDAEAVIAHITRIAAEGSTSLYAREARRIQSMRAVDDITVEFTLSSPNSQFGTGFAESGMGMIPSPTAVESEGDQFGLNPVGAGPFMVESFTPSGEVHLVANPDYYQEDLPYLERLTFIPISEESARLDAIASGDIDGASFPLASRLTEAENAGLTVLHQPWFGNAQLVPNLQRAPFDDVRIREAINLAINRDAINQVVYGGLHDVMSGVLEPTHPFFEDTRWPDNDPDAAKALVDEYVTETGQPIVVDMILNQSQEHGQIAALLQQQFEAAGITLNYTPTTPTNIVGTAFGTRDFDLILMDNTVGSETTARARALFASDGANNYGGEGNPEMDALLNDAATAISDEERIALIGPMQEVWREWLPTAPLAAGVLGRVIGPNVGGFPGGNPNPRSMDLFQGQYIWVNQ